MCHASSFPIRSSRTIAVLLSWALFYAATALTSTHAACADQDDASSVAAAHEVDGTAHRPTGATVAPSEESGSTKRSMSGATAAPATAIAIARAVADAFQPPESTVRDLTITIHTPDQSTIEWTARSARKEIDGRPAMLTVLLGPTSMTGFALLVRDEPGESDAQWMYLPPVRRVRKLVYTGKAQSFLGTELLPGDLGFFDTEHRSFELAGTKDVKGTPAYELVEIPDDPAVFSRIVTWVARDSHLPLRREYYDRAGRLWRITDYGAPTAIDGIPTILGLRVEDVQQGGETDLELSSVSYGIDVPDRLFVPEHLAQAAADPFWSSTR